MSSILTSMETATEITCHPIKLPLFLSRISAGFPSPADDYVETRKSIEDLLIKRPAAAFWLEVDGSSMNPEIKTGDLLAVDKSLNPQNGEVVVVTINGQHTVKRYIRKGARVLLTPDNPAYTAIKVTEESELELFGVVLGFVRVLCRR